MWLPLLMREVQNSLEIPERRCGSRYEWGRLGFSIGRGLASFRVVSGSVVFLSLY